MLLRLVVWHVVVGFVCTLLLLTFLDLPLVISVLYLGAPLAVSFLVVWLTARHRAYAIEARQWVGIVLVTLLALAIATFIYVPGRAALLDARRIATESGGMK